jgi:hypothetical protein
MLSQKRGVQLGLGAAALVLLGSFGILVVQGDRTPSLATGQEMSASTNQEPAAPMAVSLSARAHQQSGQEQ